MIGKILKKSVVFGAGLIAAVLLHEPAVARAEVSVRIGVGVPAPVVFEAPPRMLYLPDMGFQVAVGVPYDVLYYGSDYYLYRDGVWFVARDYRGPWVVVRDGMLPGQLRRYGWSEIRHSRDVAYRRHDRRYDGRYDWQAPRSRTGVVVFPGRDRDAYDRAPGYGQRPDGYRRDDGRGSDRHRGRGRGRD